MKIELVERLAKSCKGGISFNEIFAICIDKQEPEICLILNTLDKYDYDADACFIITSKVVEKYRTVEDKIRLVNKFMQKRGMSLKLIINEDILANRDIDEQLELIDIAEKYEYNDMVCNIIINKYILVCRTLERQIQLIKKLDECDFNQDAYEIVMIHGVGTEDKLRIMDERYVKKNTFVDEVKKISDLEEIRRYITNLKMRDENLDITSDTKVPVYKPIDKQKKEN